DRATLFDALCRAGDTLSLRWKKDGNFLLARSTSYFWDKLKEVPNRLLGRWQADRRAAGGLPLEDLLEMATLTDQQLDSRFVGEGVVHAWGLREWGMLAGRAPLRPYARYLAVLTPLQRTQI